MIRIGIFFLLFLSATVTMLASSLPRETSFVIVFLSFLLLPYRTSIVLALIGGIVVDLFSPIKGLSVATYPLGIVLSSYLSRNLLTHRSLLGLFVLGFSVTLAVIIAKLVLMSVFFVVRGDSFILLSILINQWGFFFRGSIVTILSLCSICIISDHVLRQQTV